MTRKDYMSNRVPEYYPYMYLDGYTPAEVMCAAHKRAMRLIKERQKEQDDTNTIVIKKEK